MPLHHVRGEYLHHDPINRATMAAAADIYGPTWEQPSPGCGDTILKIMFLSKLLTHGNINFSWTLLNADVSHSRTHVASAREIPSEFRAAVAAELDTDARNCGETTTDVIHDIMLAHGRDVSPGFLGTFRQDSGNRLHRVQLRAVKEVETTLKLSVKCSHFGLGLWLNGRALCSCRI